MDLNTCTVNLLQAELDRVTQLIGIDNQNAAQYRATGEKIAATQKRIAAIQQRIDRCKKADDRINTLVRGRREAYKGVFEAIKQLEEQLRELYSPLEKSLATSTGALARLDFVIRRRADVEAWATEGENLLDLRKDGPFRGHGKLLELARKQLESVWTTGTPEEVGEAVNTFMVTHADEIKSHRLESMEVREWNRRISSWLHDTTHIAVEYGLQYDGVDIERLSPGTRGIVLLLLYLDIDQTDDRPLIIDQPEENLDPQSVYDELVPRFKAVRNRRQIIIVTHNANLVVNTDVDQVIVASAGQHNPGYVAHDNVRCRRSGGIQNSSACV